jgi:anti-anti-sigma factor
MVFGFCADFINNMADIKISISGDTVEAGVSVVNVEGVVDTITAPELEKVLRSLINVKRRGIILNLAPVEYISTAGWSSIISASEKMRQNEGELVLANMIPNVSENYYLFEFDKIIRAFESEKKARAVFKQPVEAKSGQA